VLVTRDEIPDPQALTLRTYLNEQLVQDSHTGDMIFDIPTLIAFLSADSTLYPGTVILTGTPQGVAMGQDLPRYLQSGDVVTIEINGIGKLRNPVQ
jgi:2-keto-4-pentenoate hydratase/2-oxohepta-3-ene-1,7-dioic acid hydratase in catechol pathway